MYFLRNKTLALTCGFKDYAVTMLFKNATFSALRCAVRQYPPKRQAARLFAQAVFLFDGRYVLGIRTHPAIECARAHMAAFGGLSTRQAAR